MGGAACAAEGGGNVVGDVDDGGPAQGSRIRRGLGAAGGANDEQGTAEVEGAIAAEAADGGDGKAVEIEAVVHIDDHSAALNSQGVGHDQLAAIDLHLAAELPLLRQ